MNIPRTRRYPMRPLAPKLTTVSLTLTAAHVRMFEAQLRAIEAEQALPRRIEGETA